MRKIVIIAVIVAAALAGIAFYTGMFSRSNAAQAAGAQQPPAQGAAAGGGRQGGGNPGRQGGGGRGQLTVELAPVVHAEVNRELAVVGNLIGDQTVSVVPKTAGRLEQLTVKLGDRVSRGERIAKIEDQGAFVSANAPIVDVVDITRVRLVANIIEKDLKQIGVGDSARVEVDAFPGESFMGRIARLSPVLDPATRTAPIEVEIPNDQYRLKPGMYARVGIITESHAHALVVPTNALVDVGGTRGVYLSVNNVAAFHPVKVGIEGNDRTEILDGVAEGDRGVTTGAAGLRNGDPIVLAGGGGRGGRGAGRGTRGGQGAANSV